MFLLCLRFIIMRKGYRRQEKQEEACQKPLFGYCLRLMERFAAEHLLGGTVIVFTVEQLP